MTDPWGLSGGGGGDGTWDPGNAAVGSLNVVGYEEAVTAAGGGGGWAGLFAAQTRRTWTDKRGDPLRDVNGKLVGQATLVAVTKDFIFLRKADSSIVAVYRSQLGKWTERYVSHAKLGYSVYYVSRPLAIWREKRKSGPAKRAGEPLVSLHRPRQPQAGCGVQLDVGGSKKAGLLGNWQRTGPGGSATGHRATDAGTGSWRTRRQWRSRARWRVSRHSGCCRTTPTAIRSTRMASWLAVTARWRHQSFRRLGWSSSFKANRGRPTGLIITAGTTFHSSAVSSPE